MSRVTDVVLHASSVDLEGPIWLQINEWLESRGLGAFVYAAGSGGNKAAQMVIAWAAFNCFGDHADAFAAFVATIRWETPEQVVLLMTTEEDQTRVFALHEILRSPSMWAQSR